MTVGITIAGRVLATVNDLREEARADREASRAESEASRAEREADREAFQREILRLMETQARLAAVVSSTGPEE